MLGNTQLAQLPTYRLVLGFGLCTIGCAVLYAYFKTRDEEEEKTLDDSDGQIDYTKGRQNQSPAKQITTQLSVPKEQIPLLMGRSGTNLKAIEERTNTRIEFYDKDEKHEICQITGIPNAVKDARGIILNHIQRAPIVKEEVYVPQDVCGRIMGRYGEVMQEICRLSLAKITIDCGGRNGSGHDQSRIIITGTNQQVTHARNLIEEKIEENEKLRRIVEEAEQRRERRRSLTNSHNSSLYSSQTSLNSHITPREKLLNSKIDEKPMEVYVSAIASPSKFWVQLVGPQTKKLDDMVQSMTEYYSKASNRELHKIVEPYLGQIVAAVFKYDSKWYRAEIVGILPNEFDPEKLVLDLYFVDYGDSEYVSPHEVYELRTDFLTLRFQAVECFLANVKPTQNTDSWDPQAIQKFEELTRVANWKKLISRVVTYKERQKIANGSAVSSSAREGSPIPGVELFDSVDGVEVNLGHMLIFADLALPYYSPYYSPPSSISQTTNSSLNFSEESAEDALFDQQLQHLQKNKNLYLNGRGDLLLTSPTKLSSEFSNGNYHIATGDTTMTDTHNRNGNLIR